VFRGLGDTRTPLAATLGCNAVNLVLNPLLIFGLGWGVAGAAQATVLAEARAGQPSPAPTQGRRHVDWLRLYLCGHVGVAQAAVLLERVLSNT